MKKMTLLAVGAAALGLVSSARADATIYLTGSTAFRSAVYGAISNLFGLGGPYAEVTFGNANMSGANQMLWTGHVAGISGITTVEANWSGSVAGVQNLDGNLSIGGFIQTTNIPNLQASAPNATVTTGTQGSNPAFYDQTAHQTQVAMSDSYQHSTPFTTTTLDDDLVGVVPFEFVLNSGLVADPHWSRVSNITDVQAQQLLFGAVPLALISGNSDDTNFVYAVGRSKGSGNRLGTFADRGFGILSTPVQYDLTQSGPNATLALDEQASDFPGGDAGSTDGSSGYPSGGGVATALSVTGSGSSTDPIKHKGKTFIGFYAIGYVGISDANSAIGHSAKALTYNGVAYTPNNVQQGEYGFWGYEHVMGLPGLSGDPATFRAGLENQLLTGTFETTSGAGFEISTMRAQRSDDGSNPFHL